MDGGDKLWYKQDEFSGTLGMRCHVLSTHSDQQLTSQNQTTVAYRCPEPDRPVSYSRRFEFLGDVAAADVI